MKSLFYEWRLAKDMFARPAIKFFSCRSYDTKQIFLAKYNKYYYINPIRYTSQGFSKHRLPSNSRFVWRRDIRKRLKRWHLSWIKPVITIPRWLLIQVMHLNLGWKTKWSCYRHEHNPFFRVNLFGWAFGFHLNAPKGPHCEDIHYWEGLLEYLYHNPKRRLTLKELINLTGYWTSYREDSKNSYLAIRPEYLRKDKLDEYYKVANEFKAKQKDTIE